MTILANVTLTTALTATVTTAVQTPLGVPESANFQANFTYGSGGTTATVWVQTSLDGGGTWCDVCNFAFTTASKIYVFNVSALTPMTTTLTIPTDGTLTSNTVSAGAVMGPLWRCKITSTGTYAASTTLRVDMNARGRVSATT